jgi:hypothetical protein
MASHFPLSPRFFRRTTILEASGPPVMISKKGTSACPVDPTLSDPLTRQRLLFWAIFPLAPSSSPLELRTKRNQTKHHSTCHINKHSGAPVLPLRYTSRLIGPFWIMSICDLGNCQYVVIIIPKLRGYFGLPCDSFMLTFGDEHLSLLFTLHAAFFFFESSDGRDSCVTWETKDSLVLLDLHRFTILRLPRSNYQTITSMGCGIHQNNRLKPLPLIVFPGDLHDGFNISNCQTRDEWIQFSVQRPCIM